MGLLKKLFRAGKRIFEKSEIGEIYENLNSTSVLKGIYGGQVFQYMMDLPFVLLYLGLIYYLVGAAVLVPVACISLYYFVLIVMQHPVNNLRKGNSENEQEGNAVRINLLKNIFPIKALANEEIMIRGYSQSIK